MKLIAIRPPEIKIVSIDPSKDELKQLQELVAPAGMLHPSTGYIETGYTYPAQKDGTLTLFVDEEGLINPRTAGGFTLKTPNGSTLLFSGQGVICCSNDEGENISIPDSVDTAKIIASIKVLNPHELALAYEAKKMEAYE